MSNEITDLGLRVNGPLGSAPVTVAPTAAPKVKWDYDANMELIDALLDAIIAGGYPPAVTSVAGRTGAVVLGESDITGLVSDLGTLATAITSEAATRAAADTTLQSNITSEAATRAAADTTNATAISTETSRAQAAEALKAPLDSPALTTVVSIEKDNLGSNQATPVAGLIIQNTTAAANNAQQDPPAIEFAGQYWDGSANQKGTFIFNGAFGSGNPPTFNVSLLMQAAAAVGCFVVIKNTQPATSSQNTPVPTMALEGFYWNGSASTQEAWELVHSFGSGANPTSTWSIRHFGTSGLAVFDMTGGLSGTAFTVKVATAALDTSTTQAASTAFVMSQIATPSNVDARKRITSAVNALGSVSGAVAVDLSLGNTVTMTLTGNVTLSLSNAKAGQDITFVFTQDGTGGWSVTWPAGTIPVGPAPSIAASAVSVFHAGCDGTNLNFAMNGPITVFRKTLTGLTATDDGTTNQKTFQAPAIGQYEMIVTLYSTTIGAGGATATVRLFGRNANAQTPVSTAVSNTSVGLQVGLMAPFKALAASSSYIMGFGFIVTGTIGAAVYAIDFEVRYIGN